MPRGFHSLIAAQFFSALADHALLIVAIAVLAAQGLPPWWAPLLKFGFTAAYVLCAPFVGPLADSMPKARLMAWMSGVKMVGAAALLAGAHPVAAYALVGLGACAYAPAKYGLITELVPPPRLVAANGWIEVSVVFAVLFGTALGGILVSAWWLGMAAAPAILRDLVGVIGPGMPPALAVSVSLLLVLYALAAALSAGIPDSGARYARSRRQPLVLTREFFEANARLWRDPEGGLSLAVTTLFWGVGATLQFVVLRWAAERLGLGLEHGAYLQAVVGLGVAAGAAAAGRLVPLTSAKRMLAAGVVLGLALPVAAGVDELAIAIAAFAAVGALGGLLVVPLNALLQHRGAQLLTAGRSIAVQGFNENASVLAMLGVYAALQALDAPVETLMGGLGLGLAAAVSALMWREHRRAARRPTP